MILATNQCFLRYCFLLFFGLFDKIIEVCYYKKLKIFDHFIKYVFQKRRIFLCQEGTERR